MMGHPLFTKGAKDDRKNNEKVISFSNSVVCLLLGYKTLIMQNRKLDLRKIDCMKVF
jgi:hypothetical protein